MLWASYGLLRDSGRIFMEAAPRGLDPEDCIPPMTPYFVMKLGHLPLVPYFRPGDRALAEAVRTHARDHRAMLLAKLAQLAQHIEAEAPPLLEHEDLERAAAETAPVTTPPTEDA